MTFLSTLLKLQFEKEAPTTIERSIWSGFLNPIMPLPCPRRARRARKVVQKFKTSTMKTFISLVIRSCFQFYEICTSPIFFENFDVADQTIIFSIARRYIFPYFHYKLTCWTIFAQSSITNIVTMGGGGGYSLLD